MQGDRAGVGLRALQVKEPPDRTAPFPEYLNSYFAALDFCCARTLAQRARCAAAIRLRPAADILRLPLRRFVGAAAERRPPLRPETAPSAEMASSIRRSSPWMRLRSACNCATARLSPAILMSHFRSYLLLRRIVHDVLRPPITCIFAWEVRSATQGMAHVVSFDLGQVDQEGSPCILARNTSRFTIASKGALCQ